MKYCKECGSEFASDSVISNFSGYRMAEASTDGNSFIKNTPKSNKMIIAAVFAIVMILICLYVVNGDFVQQSESNSTSNISLVNNDSDYLLKEGR